MLFPVKMSFWTSASWMTGLRVPRTMETQFQNALLIHNPNAGNGGNARRRRIDEARKFLSENGIHAELAETTGPGDATEIAQRATREGRQLVIACGGDGTLNEIVNGLATAQNGHRVPLALLPGGTGIAVWPMCQ